MSCGAPHGTLYMKLPINIAGAHAHTHNPVETSTKEGCSIKTNHAEMSP